MSVCFTIVYNLLSEHHILSKTNNIIGTVHFGMEDNSTEKKKDTAYVNRTQGRIIVFVLRLT